MKRTLRTLLIPLFSLGLFLTGWHFFAGTVETALGTFPTPGSTWSAARDLVDETLAEHQSRKDYVTRMEERRERHETLQERRRKRAEERGREFTPREFRAPPYSGKPTYPEQILRSLSTVFFGFLIAIAIGIPLGILCGMNDTVQKALQPVIQIMKPVSPLAWLPLVTLVVSSRISSGDDGMEVSFVVSAIVVALCSLWPTLINTAAGVSSVSEDHLNVGRVLRLPWHTRVFKIILPSALPQIFTGMRISLGIGWMVLIAAEMLAQNPGLGKFVWDMFQNGSSQTLGMIMASIITIGAIGFLLDRGMLLLERMVTYSPAKG